MSYPRRYWTLLVLVVFAAVVAASLHGSRASALSLEGMSRFGDTFQPQPPAPGMVSKATAIRAALHFAFGRAATRAPSGVRTRAYFGLYSDTIYSGLPVWIVRFWGPGLDLEGSGGGMPLPGTPYCEPPAAHEELVVVDGTTGKYLEGTVGLVPTGLPTVVTTPAPVPTPCATRPPHPLTPWTVAMGARGNLFLGGYGLSGYREHSEVQKRSAAGRLLFSFSTQEPHGNSYQITSIALDTHGDVYVADNGNQIQKFGPNGRLIRQRFLLGHRLPQTSSWWNVAVARDGTAYVAGAPRGGTYVLSPAGKVIGTRPGRWSFLAVSSNGTLYAANVGHGLVQAFSPAGRPLRSWHMGHNPGQAIIDSIAPGRDGSVYVLDERVKVMKPFYEVVRYAPAGRVLRRIKVPQGPEAGQLMEPRDLAVGPRGTIFIADSGNPRIVRFTGTGQYLGNWTL